MASRRSRIARDVPFGREEQPPLTMQEAADIIYADQNKLAELDRIQVRRERLPLDAIRLDGGTQPRAALNDALIDEYAEEMKTGANFPPGDVYYDGENYWLSSGFHRWHARQRSGFEDMEVNVHQGTQRDAQLASVGENAAHGLRRSNEDKRRAVELLLRDAEWGQWSDREIARLAHVSQPFVGTLRRELSDNGYQIGEKKRLVERDGTVYRQKVSSKKRQTEVPSKSRSLPEQDEPALSVNGLQIEVASPAIGATLLHTLRGRSLTWSELYNAVEETLGVFVDRDGFNATLREFVKAGWVITDPNDQAAYMLAREALQETPQQAEVSAHDVLLGKGKEFSSLGAAFDEVPEGSFDAIAVVAAQVIDGLYYLAKVSPDVLREFDQAQLALLDGEYHKVLAMMGIAWYRAISDVKDLIARMAR